MNNLNSIKNIVLELLKTDERTRKDDLYLYTKVIEIATADDQQHKEEIAVFNKVLLHYLKWKMPNTKTILRARQAIQAKHPELTDKETAEKRNRHRKQMKQLVLEGFFDSDDIECEEAE